MVITCNLAKGVRLKTERAKLRTCKLSKVTNSIQTLTF